MQFGYLKWKIKIQLYESGLDRGFLGIRFTSRHITQLSTKESRNRGTMDMLTGKVKTVITLSFWVSHVIMEMIRRFSLSSMVECFLGMIMQHKLCGFMTLRRIRY